MKQYEILETSSPADLKEMLVGYVADGWRLVGPVQVVAIAVQSIVSRGETICTSCVATLEKEIEPH